MEPKRGADSKGAGTHAKTLLVTGGRKKKKWRRKQRKDERKAGQQVREIRGNETE